MINTYEVSIVIVTFNTRELTDNCIKSIFKFSEGLSFEIILVDNASTDGSKEFFENYDGIKYLYLDQNLGFGKANNLGVDLTTGEYVFFLNSDTILIENSIKKIVSFFEQNIDKLKIGSLGCVLIDENHNLTHSSQNIPTSYSVLKTLFLSNFFPSYGIDLKNTELKQYKNAVTEVGYVTGADLMIKRDVFLKLGGFHHIFFMYYEDSYLHYELKNKLHLKSYIINTTKIIHLEGQSSNPISLSKLYMIEKSLLHYARLTSSLFCYQLFKIFYFFLRFQVLLNRKKSWNEKIKYLKQLFKLIT